MGSMAEQLTATEAAARLGVKRATLYAYVSRGLLERSVALDGRTSLFDAAEVDALRTDRRRTARGEVGAVISSSITKLDEAGHQYRDRLATSLVEDGLSYEQVCELLWQRDYDCERWRLPEDLAADVMRVQSALGPATPGVDRLRVSVSVASGADPLRNAQSSSAFTDAGRTMILAMALGLGSGSAKQLASCVKGSASVPELLWPGLTKGSRRPGARCNDERLVALQTALILMADHGLAASTFGVRIAVSVRADPYSAVATGLGSIGGVLHGSAPKAVVRLFERSTEVGAKVAVGERLGNGERVPGFGHSIYRQVDPRRATLMAAIESGWAGDPRLDLVHEVYEVVGDRLDQPANVDLAMGAMAWLGHMDQRVTTVFAIARTAGWIAHALEEMGERPVRFRPAARYVPNHPDPNRVEGD